MSSHSAILYLQGSRQAQHVCYCCTQVAAILSKLPDPFNNASHPLLSKLRTALASKSRLSRPLAFITSRGTCNAAAETG